MAASLRRQLYLVLLALVALLAGCAGNNSVGTAPALDAPLTALAVPGPVLVSPLATPADLMQADVKMLAGTIGDRRVGKYTSLCKAADYIAAQFTAAGYTVTRQTFTAGGKSVSNIIANKAGATATAPLVLIGGHYDTDNNPGADDNASSVAIVLETARLLKSQTTKSKIRFVAFVNEEEPYNDTSQQGALVCAKAIKAAGEKLTGMLNLDMSGYFPSSKKYFIVGNNTSSATLASKATALWPTGTTMKLQKMSSSDPDIKWCDNGAFWKQGYAALLYTSPGYYDDPNYHSRTDTYEKLSYTDMANAANGLVAVLKGL